MNISNRYQNYVWMGLSLGILSLSILALMGKAAGVL